MPKQSGNLAKPSLENGDGAYSCSVFLSLISLWPPLLPPMVQLG